MGSVRAVRMAKHQFGTSMPQGGHPPPSLDHLIVAALFFGRVLPRYLWLLSADQRTAPSLERAEGFRARDGGARLVEVAGVLRLGGLLHLEQIGVLNLTSVGAHHTLAEQAVVGRPLLHPGDQRPVAAPGPLTLHGPAVMDDL